MLLLRSILCLVFAVAGVTKLVDTRSTRHTLHEFGVPASLVAPFGLLLPLAELATAVLLAIGSLAWLGALSAFVLLLVFIVAIAVNISRGRRPNCRCFGELSSKPISGRTIVRNVGLALVASVFVYLADDIPQWRDLPMSGEGIALWGLVAGLVGMLILLVAVIVEGWFIVNLLRQNGRLLIRLEKIEAHLGVQGDAGPISQEISAGLPPGTAAPAFELPDLDGNPHQLLQPLSLGKRLMLIFFSPRCSACDDLLPDITQWENDKSFPFEITVVTQGPIHLNKKKFNGHDAFTVLLQEQFEVENAYGVEFTPSALVIGPDGTIDTPLLLGTRAIRRFVADL